MSDWRGSARDLGMSPPREPKQSPPPSQPTYSEATAATFRAALGALAAKPDPNHAALVALFDEGRFDDAAAIERIFTGAAQ